MEHLQFQETPVTQLIYFSKKLNVNLSCKRDDLFPEAGGGSKARMLQYILADLSPEKYDVMVTAGGPCSNFNRACALMCAKLGVPMHLVEYTDQPDEFNTSLNYFLCNMAGVIKTRCEKTNVPATIKDVLNSYEGKRIKHIYGGGKSIQGIYAYFEAVSELSKQVDSIDHVFLACGTGTTLTGICAGMQKFFPKAKVHAISTARTFKQEKPVLEDDLKILNDYLSSNYTFENMTFTEDYLCGGYDKATPELLRQVKECVTKEGMIVDPCYSGKAFYGMIEEVRKTPEQYAGKNILFWNTGGIFNLLSMRDNYEF